MNPSCVSLADIDAAIACSDSDNVGGIKQEIIYGYWEDVATWPTLPAATSNSELTLEAAGKWAGELAMKTGKRAFRMEFTDENGEFTMTDQGEAGGESVLYQLDIVRAKINSVILGFMNATRGRKMFFIVTDRNGTKYLMGDAINAAKRIAGDAVTSGKATTDLANVPLRFTYVCPRNLIYAGSTDGLLTTATGGEDEDDED